MGFPIRISPDHSLVSGSPKLFAATRVLLRLLSPRHPSCTLSSLVSRIFSIPSIRKDQGPARRHLTLPDAVTSHSSFSLFTCAYALVKDRLYFGARPGLHPPMPQTRVCLRAYIGAATSANSSRVFMSAGGAERHRAPAISTFKWSRTESNR